MNQPLLEILRRRKRTRCRVWRVEWGRALWRQRTSAIRPSRTIAHNLTTRPTLRFRFSRYQRIKHLMRPPHWGIPQNEVTICLAIQIESEEKWQSRKVAALHRGIGFDQFWILLHLPGKFYLLRCRGSRKNETKNHTLPETALYCSLIILNKFQGPEEETKRFESLDVSD